MQAQETTTPVPPLNLKANFAQIRDEVLPVLTEICESGFYVLGPRVAEFERQLAEYCGTGYALGLSSGTDALLVALMTLGIGPGDEVIVPTFTFFATAGCVARVGARPVFCDIEPQTFNLDTRQVESLITGRTRAIIPVHLYGQLADTEPLLELGRRRGLAVIEDAAQAIGAADPRTGKLAGSLGTFGCISFYPTKNLGAIGDAGALLTSDAELHAKATTLRLHGETSRYHHKYVGGNFRIDPIQAAVLAIKLKRLEEWNARRRELAANYNRLLTEAGLVGGFLSLPHDAWGTHVYHQYVVRARRRDELFAALQQQRIGAGIYYPVPLHLQECFASLGYSAGEFPVAEQAAAEVLALPIYPELSEQQQEVVVGAIARFYGR